ncbi:hydroxymethylbilane synthase [Isoptericola variabilis]|uniref:Porphobilinogen deaminase n=1 Tax=Isoptericola variabilis (strain 225) TaxID=743718 RepID=F6FVP5_ISOV2|nr:hydroxymethylbilane synthase [Isoptericola variabilis]AEG45546.1 Porphobilinogen deaminase [Isoptericola variabilis 225]TWH25850.1 hydroxymethylbilane synthase [Isoptericola variabilis J7]
MSTPAEPGTAPLRLGTRGSALAMTQSGMVARRLTELLGRPVELVRIRTEGDVKTGSLASLGGTGVFVTALREALLDGRCDVAVHSLKDLPTTQPPELTVVTPEREDPRDVLCARDGLTLETLPRGSRVGTGSPRRAAQLKAARPDVEIVDIRGNVDTRLARALGPEADLDAVVLAHAGLTRLGRTDVVTEVLPPGVVAPAPGQGALAVEARTADLQPGAPDGGALARAFAALDHRATRVAVIAERTVLARLEAGCAAPVGAYARVEDGALHLGAVVARVDGTEQLKHRASVELAAEMSTAALDAVATELGERVAEALLADGADRLAPLRPGTSAASPELPTGASRRVDSAPLHSPTGTDDPEGA